MKDMMQFITLTTDFGTRDGFVGTLKGVIWNICPTVQIADISHEIAPQNVIEGAYALWRAAPFFPEGTIHVAVIDPGVGTSRRKIAVKIDKQYFIGPDNGVFSPLLEEANLNKRFVDIVELTQSKYWLPQVSNTFHGRDIFAPVAAFLAQGTPFDEFGPHITDPYLLELPKPIKTKNGWKAHITIIDVFGNLTTDLHSSHTGDLHLHFDLHGRSIQDTVPSYGHRSDGELIALVDSEGYFEIAQVNGNAAKEIGAKVGDIVEVRVVN